MSRGRERAPHPSSLPEDGGRGVRSLLLAVIALSLLPRLYLASRLPLSHNGAWFLFAARNFGPELGRIAHPPLFLLVLKACDAVSRTLFSYRLVPLAAGVASVYLVGRILAKVGCLPVTSALGALALGFSTVALVLSNQVEGYSLCVFFVLMAFDAYLDLARMDRTPPARSRVAFAVFAALAVATEYLAGIFVAACALVPFLAAIFRASYRRQLATALPRRIAADVLTLLPPIAAGGALYLSVARRFATSLSGLPLFYYRPGLETPLEFVRRGLGATVHLFSPLIDVHRAAVPVLFLAAVVAIAATDRGDLSRSLPAAMFAAILGLGALLGLLRLYPFGGTHRHQVLILVFAIFAGFVALDRILRAVSPGWGTALAALAGAGIAANLAVNASKLPLVTRDEPFDVQAGTYARSLAGVRVVHLDLMNFLALFMDYYAWDCRFAGRVSENPRIERYELAADGRRLTVFAHRWIWIMDFRKPALYYELASSIAKGRCETAFAVDRNLYYAPRTPRPIAERAELGRAIPTLSGAAGLNLSSMTIGDDLVAAELCAGR